MRRQALDLFYSVVFRLWRPRRFARFIAAIAPSSQDSILDVGGIPSCWQDKEHLASRIDTVNTDRHEPLGRISAIIADGCALPFEANAYSIAFSNSVIEHVGSWERQQLFATEIRRVGRRIWVQTPAMEFPVEPHFLAIGFHWLPRRIQPFVAKWLTPRGWLSDNAAEFAASTRLLTKREMKLLFPDCEILTERFLGLPKSYIAIRR